MLQTWLQRLFELTIGKLKISYIAEKNVNPIKKRNTEAATEEKYSYSKLSRLLKNHVMSHLNV